MADHAVSVRDLSKDYRIYQKPSDLLLELVMRKDQHVKFRKFRRNQAVADFAVQWRKVGHEVALHVDPFYYFINHEVDGAMATEVELK